MPRFRKKPVVITAVKFRGSTSQAVAIERWMAGDAYIDPRISTRDMRTLRIETLEGVMEASAGDWIIRGVQGEFYPCKPDIFEATYEPAED